MFQTEMKTEVAKTPGHGKPLVMVADDDEDVLALVSMFLEEAGCDVVRVNNGDAALEVATEVPLDLAVIDVTMPGKDGLEVTEAMRADSAAKDVPVILLTARGRDADVQRGFAAGADDYVPKPFNSDQLQALVRSVLGRVSQGADGAS